jgi:hypothetical protein
VAKGKTFSKAKIWKKLMAESCCLAFTFSPFLFFFLSLILLFDVPFIFYLKKKKQRE